MSTLITFLPLLLTVPLYGALVKLASRIYHRSQLRWKHAFAFGALGMALGGLGSLLHKSTGAVLPALVVSVLSLSLQLALGGWFLGPRAMAASGSPVSFKGGAAIAAIAGAFGLTLGVLVSLVLPTLLAHGQA